MMSQSRGGAARVKDKGKAARADSCSTIEFADIDVAVDVELGSKADGASV